MSGIDVIRHTSYVSHMSPTNDEYIDTDDLSADPIRITVVRGPMQDCVYHYDGYRALAFKLDSDSLLPGVDDRTFLLRRLERALRYQLPGLLTGAATSLGVTVSRPRPPSLPAVRLPELPQDQNVTVTRASWDRLQDALRLIREVQVAGVEPFAHAAAIELAYAADNLGIVE